MENADRIHRNYYRPEKPNLEAVVRQFYFERPYVHDQCTVIDAWACAIAPDYTDQLFGRQPCT